MLSCATCGRGLLEGDEFCSACGTPAGALPEDGASGHEVAPGSPWDEVVQRLQRATLGEFEIGPELGRGAMAAVFLAREISLDRKVAIKVMSPGLLMDEGMAERFKREAITIAHLNHPNIVSVHSVRQVAGLHFFVMRHIHGRSLEQVIQRAGRLPIPIVRSILYQVGSALTYAHRSRVVHRDIKPANILIDEDGNAVVTDFGIAKVAELPSATHPGALVGTPAYMSPEQCSGDDVSGASDQYALGVVAYEMITGVSPFTGSTYTVMQGHMEQAPRPLQHHVPECPPELESAVLRMLEKEPSARWPSIADARAALGAAPLGENDPLLAELCRLATPDWTTSLPGTPASAAVRTKASAVQPATSAGTVRSITILPPPDALETGDSFTLVAMLRGELGVPLPGRAVQWATDTPEVLRVDSQKGIATAVAPGSARLTATCEGVRARLQVLVAAPLLDDSGSQPGVVAIQVSAPPKSVKAGDSFVLTATPLDHRGGFLLGHTVQWSTSDVSIAVVTASGWVATLGQGTVELKATCQGATASVVIDVQEGRPAARRTRPPVPAPHYQAPAAVAPAPPVPEHRPIRRRRPHSRRRRLIAASIGVLLLTPVLWLVGGLPPLAVPDIYPRSAALSEPRTIDLTPGEPVAAILRGAPASVAIIRRPRRVLPPGGTGRFLAEVRDRAGGSVAGSIVRWSSSNPRVVRVDSATGRVRALREGRAWVVAASGELKDSGAIVVRAAAAEPAAAARVWISPHGPLQVGDTVTLAAAVLDGRGATVAGAELAWSASEPSIAAVDASTGHVLALAPGTVSIMATSGPATATSQLTVIPAEELVADTVPVQAYEPPEPLPAEEPEPVADDHPDLDAVMSMGVQDCYDALSSKNVARVTALYRPANASDSDKLAKLTRILRTGEWDAVVGERVDGARHLDRARPAADFSFQLVWKDAFGGRLSSRPVFRVEFDRSGNGWDFSSCRILGSPKL